MATTNIFHFCYTGYWLHPLLGGYGSLRPHVSPVWTQFWLLCSCWLLHHLHHRSTLSNFNQQQLWLPLSLLWVTLWICTLSLARSLDKLPIANLLCENRVYFHADDAFMHTPVSQDDPDPLSELGNSSYCGNQWLTSPSPNNKKHFSQGKYNCVVKYHLLPLYLQYISIIWYLVMCKMPLLDNLRHQKPFQDPCMKIFSIG